MKRSAFQHTKLGRLEKSLHVEKCHAVGILECLWNLAARETPRGNIGKLSDVDIATALGWSRPADELVKSLVDCGWVDLSDKYRLIIHDWHDHCEDSVRKLLKRNGWEWASTPPNGETNPDMAGNGSPCRDKSACLSLSLSLKPEPKPEPGETPVLGFVCESEETHTNARERATACVPSLDKAKVNGNGGADDLFPVFWEICRRTGKPLNDKDQAKARTAWGKMPEVEREPCIRWLVDQIKHTWSDALHTPMPANILSSEGWKREVLPRSVRGPDERTKLDRVMELFVEEMRKGKNAKSTSC